MCSEPLRYSLFSPRAAVALEQCGQHTGFLSMYGIKPWVVLLLVFTVSWSAAARSVGDVESSPAVAAHVKKANRIAGEDFKFLSDGILCAPAELAIPIAIKTVPGFLDPKAPPIEPFAAFDNLYYIGFHAWGTWLLDTGDGLILFDALNNEGDVKNILLPGMARFGFKPEDLKYLIVTHGHFDHYGGARYLQKQYGVRVMMSEADWDYLPDDIAWPFAVKSGYPAMTPPDRDWVVEDGDVLSLGNASVTFAITPGHTPGTLSTFITVKDRGETKAVSMWGGQALHPSIKELVQMHNSLHKFWSLGIEHGVQGLISTHAWFVGNFAQHARGRINGKNPLLIGAEGFDRAMQIYDECISAQFARSNAKLVRE